MSDTQRRHRKGQELATLEFLTARLYAISIGSSSEHVSILNYRNDINDPILLP